MTEIKVVKEKYNPLLKRKELMLVIDHPRSGTPPRFTVRKALAEKYKAELNSCYVIKLETARGSNRTFAEANIYDNNKRVKSIVPKHIQIRNMPPEERTERKKKTVKKIAGKTTKEVNG